MDINEFRRVVTAFADEPSDVDVRLGRFTAQIRDEIFDVSISFSEDQALMVTENDQTSNARSWVLNRVAKLPQLAEKLISHLAASPDIEAKSPFVNPEGFFSPDLSASTSDEDKLVVESALDCLLQRASSPLPGATSVVYVTSDAGEGKTTIINKAAKIQAQRFKERRVGSLIVPIPLGGKAFLTFDDAVIAALVNKLRFNYFYFDAFVELIKMGAIVPAFDGYEEMLVEGSKNEAVSALGNLVQSLDSSGTVFIAARKAFFEYLSFKTQAKLLDAIGDRSASFSRLAISRWTKTQFCEYGRMRGNERPEEIYELVSARLGSDHPLLTRAVLVRRLFDVVSNQDDRDNLVDLLGSAPHDYFYTFVDAIVKREASEKWLSKVSGEVREPLLSTDEHHELLALIAQEMWQSSVSSIRYDIIDVLVDIFCEGKKKPANHIRQIKERIRQHSLLAADSSKGQALSFDHDDFLSFYIGEALGRLLTHGRRADIQMFLAVSGLPAATVEQAIQYLSRNGRNMKGAFSVLSEINMSESGFTFCKENCSDLLMRILECHQEDGAKVVLSSMLLSPDSLDGQALKSVKFENSHFQPTSTARAYLVDVEFENCEFERLEVDVGSKSLVDCTFTACKIDCLLVMPEEDYFFDPAQIADWLVRLGARVDEVSADQNMDLFEQDERMRVLERFLRVFLRSTQADDNIIRLRLGSAASTLFFDRVLPELMSNKLLEEVPWKGKGMQHRYKLLVPMSSISAALEESRGSFDRFLSVFH